MSAPLVSVDRENGEVRVNVDRLGFVVFVTAVAAFVALLLFTWGWNVRGHDTVEITEPTVTVPVRLVQKVSAFGTAYVPVTGCQYEETISLTRDTYVIVLCDMEIVARSPENLQIPELP